MGWFLFSAVVCIGCKCSADGADQSSVSSGDEASDADSSPGVSVSSLIGDPLAYKKTTRTYAVRLETTRGEIVIDVYRDLAPKGADRFRDLVTSGFYNGVPFHEAKDGFAVRAGISPDPAANTLWHRKPVPRDPVVQQNKVGWVALQTTGNGAPCTEFVISLRDNVHLDAAGVAPFGRVRDMQTPDRMAFEYENLELPDPKRLQREGGAYLTKAFPKLASIVKATLLEED